MQKIKTQANAIVKNLYAVLRGTSVAFRIHHAPQGGYHVYASTHAGSVTPDGSQLCHIDDLSIDNVPYILNCLSIATGESICMTLHVTVRPNKRTVYVMDVKHASGARRVSAALATVLYESACRSDEVEITHSRRTDEVSFREYREYYQISTIGA